VDESFVDLTVSPEKKKSRSTIISPFQSEDPFEKALQHLLDPSRGDEDRARRMEDRAFQIELSKTFASSLGNAIKGTAARDQSASSCSSSMKGSYRPICYTDCDQMANYCNHCGNRL
jgi:hypothetical protein